MPRGDRTGPLGMGAMSGRGRGYCKGYGMPGFAQGAVGGPGGMGLGRGGFGVGGFGRRQRFSATTVPTRRRYGAFDPVMGTVSYRKPVPGMERQMLKRQAEALQVELEVIQQRLANMKDDNAAED